MGFIFLISYRVLLEVAKVCIFFRISLYTGSFFIFFIVSNREHRLDLVSFSGGKY